MSFHSRLLWMFIGIIAGSGLGYIVRMLQESKERREIMENPKVSKHNLIQSVALFLVVAITVTAAIFSQRSSNKITDTQEKFNREVACNQLFTDKVISALNARTTFTSEQASANVNLQTAQVNFLKQLTASPPIGEQEAGVALNTYISALNNFLTVQGKTTSTIDNNPYPTTEDFNKCLNTKGK